MQVTVLPEPNSVTFTHQVEDNLILDFLKRF